MQLPELGMERYRLYILDPLTGRIDHERRMLAKDDETAVWISEGLRHSRPMELWQGRSKIHRWDAIKRMSVEPRRADILSVSQPALLVH